SIRDMKTIVEAIGEFGTAETDPLLLTERVRSRLSAQLAYSYAGLENRLPAGTLDPIIEDTLRAANYEGPRGVAMTLEPEVISQLIVSIADALAPVVQSGVRPVILTNADLRRFVRKVIELDLPQIPVLSFDELPQELLVQPIGRARL